MSYTIDITEHVKPMLNGVGAGLRSGEVENVIGRAGAEFTRAHLFAYDAAHPNRLGGRRTHFYSAAGKGTSFEAKPGEVVISVNKVGIRQRLEGGTIRPTGGKKFLTIPARAEAHGRRAGEFQNLRFIKFSGDTAALVEGDQTNLAFGRERKDGSRKIKGTTVGGLVLFWLKKSVTQKPDPSVLPTAAQIAGVAVAAAQKWLAGLMARRTTGGANA